MIWFDFQCTQESKFVQVKRKVEECFVKWHRLVQTKNVILWYCMTI